MKLKICRFKSTSLWAVLLLAIGNLFLFTATATATLRIMPLGDSITYGMGAGPATIAGGYRDPLAHYLTTAGVSFQFVGSDSTNSTSFLNSTGQQWNEGHTGWRIDQIQGSINSWQAAAYPDVVLLLIGANDMIQGWDVGTGGNDTSHAIGRLQTLISTLYTNNPNLKVILSNLTPIQDSRNGWVLDFNTKLVNTVIPYFTAQGRNITLVDNYSNFVNSDNSWNPSVFADYAHPNAAGYAKMAQTYGAACVSFSPANWMSGVPGDLYVSQLSIPGSHESGATSEPFPGTAQCQNMDIASQLNSGTRYFDIRCECDGTYPNASFEIHHGIVWMGYGFGAGVVNPVIVFLQNHPTETVILQIKEENSSVGNAFASTLEQYIANYPSRWYTSSSIPKLQDVRGKIVLVRRFGLDLNNQAIGLDVNAWADDASFTAGNFIIEDNYQIKAITPTQPHGAPIDDFPLKETEISANIQKAISGSDPKLFYLTFTSGVLLGVPSYPGTVANKINPWLRGYLSTNFGRIGTILMDFTEEDLAKRVYVKNKQNPPPPPPASPPPPPLVNATYEVQNVATGMAVTVQGAGTANMTPLVQSPFVNGLNQRWNVNSLPNGMFYMTDATSGKAMEIHNASLSEGAPADLFDWNGGLNEMWFLNPASVPGTYNIIFFHSGKALQVRGGSTADGAALEQDAAAPYSATFRFLQLPPALANGRYACYVRSTGMAVTVQGAGTANMTPLVQMPYVGSRNQQWDVTSLGNGQFYMTDVNSGKAMEIHNALPDNFAAADLFDWNGGINEKWYLEYQQDGWASLVFAHSGKVLEVTHGSTVAGAAIDQYQNNTNGVEPWNAWFHFGLTSAQPANPLYDATYEVKVISTGMAVTVSPTVGGAVNMTPLVQSTFVDSPNQRWNVFNLGNGQYYMTDAQSGKAMEIHNASLSDGAAADLFDWNGGSNELWYLNPAYNDPGNYNIMFVHSGKALEVRGNSTADGAALEQYQLGLNGISGTNAHFAFVQIPPALANARYVCFARSTGMAVTVSPSAQGPANGTPLVQMPYVGGLNQKWDVTSLGNGQFYMTDASTGKAMEIHNALQDNFAAADLFDWNGGSNEKWVLMYQQDGWASLVFVHSGKIMEVSHGSTVSGAAIDQYQANANGVEPWNGQFAFILPF
jgi:1-phosphatidylinositol phosphodiesterase